MERSLLVRRIGRLLCVSASLFFFLYARLTLSKTARRKNSGGKMGKRWEIRAGGGEVGVF